MEKQLRIALAGNPNSGKTTLFNKLTGSNQFVGNWPGVTVEKKEGRLIVDKNVILTDLPGIYSLSYWNGGSFPRITKMRAVVPSFCHSPSRNYLTPASHLGVSVSCGCRNKTAMCF